MTKYILLILSLFVLSCDDPTEHDLVGVWKNVSDEGELIIYNEDKTAINPTKIIDS